MGTVIDCSSVSKTFRIPVSEHHSLRGKVLHPLSRTQYREFKALEDVSFSVEEGEFFGIVGRNGSGKSTLLKILAGIYRADRGSIESRGSLAPFIELGVGFNFELSARDNVFLNGALLGLSKRQLLDRYDHIVEFAELEQFMELKLANFSSGMQVRLAFAIAVESDADILLIDEVLAVGDQRFQRKCFDVFRARKRAGKTVVFVSHDMGSVKEFCDRVILLEQGELVASGTAKHVADAYYELNLPERAQRSVADASQWIRNLRIDPMLPRDTDTDPLYVEHGARLTISMEVHAQRDVSSPKYGFVVSDLKGKAMIATNTGYLAGPAEPLCQGSPVQVSFSFDNHLGAGTYTLSATLEDGASHEVLDMRRDTLEFTVASDQPTGATIEVPHAIKVTGVPALPRV